MLTFLAVLTILQLGLFAFFWLAIYRPHIRMSYVYPLYAVRDKLIQLVAVGKLQEESFIFQEFYKATNMIIPKSHSLTLRLFVEAVREAREKGHDPATEKRLKEIKEALSKLNDREIDETVRSFYEAVMHVLVSNSVILRIVRWLNWSPRPPTLTLFQKRTWSILTDYRNAASSLPCAV